MSDRYINVNAVKLRKELIRFSLLRQIKKTTKKAGDGENKDGKSEKAGGGVPNEAGETNLSSPKMVVEAGEGRTTPETILCFV